MVSWREVANQETKLCHSWQFKYKIKMVYSEADVFKIIQATIVGHTNRIINEHRVTFSFWCGVWKGIINCPKF